MTSFVINVLFVNNCCTAFAKPASLALSVPLVGRGRTYASATPSPGTVFASPLVIISITSFHNAFDLLVAVASLR